ncbi:YfhO family protein [Sediminibacterium soli]|uniref:YfhO family protein n=1 Tax=Sediminibacterium soli TaxID=2698829 RepID=UPI001379FBAD|nr:YfhO family protein [Sediminibacterium soli]NCI46609.1 YfhO family protein [Sediminibacterium soli]
MKTFQWKSLVPHLIAIAVFLVVALVYCKPTLEGKVLQQHDVTQWKGMAQNSFVYKEKHGYFPLWSNGMFSGMPAFQITSVGTNPVSIVYANNILTLNLPKPVSFFFLACVCFYFLSQVLKVNPYVGLFGALAYAYTTYNPIIVSVGHDTKMMAIAYLPAFVASLLMLYNKKYRWGTALTALFTGLLISVNHLQITYYGMLIALVISISFGIDWLKKKEYKRLATSVGLVIVAALLGVMVNAVSLLTTYEYSKRTIRGGSELADAKSATTKTGLTKDYAMSYSMYKTEPLVMMFPRLYGGSSGNLEVAETKSKAIESLQQMPQQLGQVVQGALQFYWGGIYENGGTSGPPYIGAIVCLLALIGFVILDGKHKWWILTACILAILMSWGKYFEGFNSLLLSTLPMYNKFRAPSMIIVIPTLLLSMMAILTLNRIISDPDREQLFLKYKKGLIAVAAVFALALLVYFMSDFTGLSDKQFNDQFGPQIASIPDQQQKAAIQESTKSFFSALREDRKDLFMGSVLRTLLFVVIAAAALFLYLKRKISALVLTVVLGIFSFVDLIVIDTFYLNEKHYQDAAEYDNSFKPSAVDEQILKDTGYYRIFDFRYGAGNAFNGGASPSYFHKSIGGYHPAKLSIYQDLIEKQLYNFPNCLPVIDMLNTKYIIAAQNGQEIAQVNPNALGAAWFVKNITYKKTSAEIMDALTGFNPRDTALVEESARAQNLAATPATDSSAFIKLVYNDNDIIEYQSSSKAAEFAVFSEVYYDAGWVATIDGKETPIIRTNYVLRGLQVPAGNHRIVFAFKPASFYRGNTAAIGASAIIWLMLIGAAVASLRKPKETA